jgi:hypothetical protein
MTGDHSHNPVETDFSPHDGHGNMLETFHKHT